MKKSLLLALIAFSLLSCRKGSDKSTPKTHSSFMAIDGDGFVKFSTEDKKSACIKSFSLKIWKKSCTEFLLIGGVESCKLPTGQDSNPNTQSSLHYGWELELIKTVPQFGLVWRRRYNDYDGDGTVDKYYSSSMTVSNGDTNEKEDLLYRSQCTEPCLLFRSYDKDFSENVRLFNARSKKELGFTINELLKSNKSLESMIKSH